MNDAKLLEEPVKELLSFHKLVIKTIWEIINPEPEKSKQIIRKSFCCEFFLFALCLEFLQKCKISVEEIPEIIKELQKIRERIPHLRNANLLSEEDEKKLSDRLFQLLEDYGISMLRDTAEILKKSL
ncbi:MAG: hypothetical protein A2430_00925 [Candidatus Liptonbacteria bacterium RIFOXYC1_FULL_36_8]|uniref:Uncharacterized protein n=2 Tax=Candidatus Liptoniibacteriota TaxID=1817909 RepID=A0A1G2CR54_9BACT|nr:MAG: hypothetical protein A2430_00925 [Candidatus Liptonbacteria bacterium RIFOXYC1_FULL_36_8]OGZ04297.1 MAG: hypothetical protein A2604_00815 [Candidatus Liptonbacteria bacterium RIFOXYD1_FULL_36_11]